MTGGKKNNTRHKKIIADPERRKQLGTRNTRYGGRFISRYEDCYLFTARSNFIFLLAELIPQPLPHPGGRAEPPRATRRKQKEVEGKGGGRGRRVRRLQRTQNGARRVSSGLRIVIGQITPGPPLTYWSVDGASPLEDAGIPRPSPHLAFSLGGNRRAVAKATLQHPPPDLSFSACRPSPLFLFLNLLSILPHALWRGVVARRSEKCFLSMQIKSERLSRDFGWRAKRAVEK